MSVHSPNERSVRAKMNERSFSRPRAKMNERSFTEGRGPTGGRGPPWGELGAGAAIYGGIPENFGKMRADTQTPAQNSCQNARALKCPLSCVLSPRIVQPILRVQLVLRGGSLREKRTVLGILLDIHLHPLATSSLAGGEIRAQRARPRIRGAITFTHRR